MVSRRYRLFHLMLAGTMRRQTAKRLTEDLAETRRSMERLGMRARPPKSCRTEPCMMGSVPAEWIVPEEVSNGRVFLYLHGGAYCLGSIDSHRFLGGYLAELAKMKVVLIDYRLAPEHPMPAAVEDTVAAYRHLLKQGMAPEKIIVGGDSAGGGLTIAALTALKEAGEPLPGRAVCISPWVDLSGSGRSMESKRHADLMLSPELLARYAAYYLNGRDASDPVASPLFADLSGLPPLLILVGTEEILLDDARRLAEKATAAGVEVTLEVWQQMIHVWPALALVIPEGRQALIRIKEFIENGR